MPDSWSRHHGSEKRSAAATCSHSRRPTTPRLPGDRPATRHVPGRPVHPAASAGRPADSRGLETLAAVPAALARVMRSRLRKEAFKQAPTTRRGLIINGGGCQGKTETACEVAAAFEDSWLELHHLNPDAIPGTRDLHIPVAYVQTPVTAKPKSTCKAILDFYGADHKNMDLPALIRGLMWRRACPWPGPGRRTGAVLRRSGCRSPAACGPAHGRGPCACRRARPTASRGGT